MEGFPTFKGLCFDHDLKSGDRVILHTVVHHSSTSATRQISLKSKELFVDKQTYGRTFETGFIKPTLKSRPKKLKTTNEVPLQQHFCRPWIIIISLLLIYSFQFRSAFQPHWINWFPNVTFAFQSVIYICSKKGT